MSDKEPLDERVLRAIHEPDSDVELLAHEIAASDEAQSYLMEVISTLSALSPSNKAAQRASALLEQSMAIAGEHAIKAEKGVATSAKTRATVRDPSDDTKR